MKSPAKLTNLLGIRYPLLQAGMGGVADPSLAAAASNAGAGGCLGGYKLSGEDLSATLRRLLSLTAAPTGVNLIPEVVGPEKLTQQVQEVLAQTPERVYLFFFGVPSPEILRLAREAKRVLIVQVGTVDEARAAAEYADAIVAQGTEAGGHLLGILPRDELVARVRAELPRACVVAAGGIGTRSQADRAFDAGADGICAGTAFATARESRAHPDFKTAVVKAEAGDTVVTTVHHIGWPGRRHRVLRSKVTDHPDQPARIIGRTEVAGKSYLIPRFSAAVPTVSTTGTISEMARYCGMSCDGVTRQMTSAELIAQLVG